MVLEWLRRGDPKFAEHLKTYLFTEGPVTEIEAAMAHGGGDGGGCRRRARRQPGHRQPAAAQAGDQMKNHLSATTRRSPKPAGQEIEKEAKRTLRALLAAPPRRRLPRAAGLGHVRRRARPRRSDRLAARRQDVQARLRRIQPLVELRIPFEMTPRRARRHRPRRARSRPRYRDGGGARDRHRRGPLDLPRLRGRPDHRHLPGAGQRGGAARHQPRRLSRRGVAPPSPSCATTASKARSPWC